MSDRSAPGSGGPRSGDAAPRGGVREGRNRPSLTHRTFTAVRWRFLMSIVEAVLQLGVGVLLARLLPPRDFGLLGLALIFVGLTTLFATLGLGPTVIQRRVLTDRHIRTAFTLSSLLGISVTTILIALAPYTTLVFPNDQLPPVVRLVALKFAIVGFGTVAAALLRRRLDFRTTFWVSSSAYLIGYGVVAVSLALAGFGVWSLAIGSLVQSLMQTILLLAMVRHPMKPLLSGPELRELTSFGLGFSLNGLVYYAAHKGDYFVIGRWLGDDALGLYTRAYQLMMLPYEQFGMVIRSVLFPAFAEIQDDRTTLGRAYLLSIQVTTIAAAPLLAGMLVAAPHMIVGLYGPNWEGTILPLQILCLFGSFRALYPLSTALINAIGRVYWTACAGVVYAGLIVGGGIVASRWGIAAVAWVVGISLSVMYVIVSAKALAMLGLRWRQLLAAHLAGLVVALVVALAALTARSLLEGHGLPSILIFAVIVLACTVAMGATLHLLPPPLRPTELYERFAQVANRLPARTLRVSLSWLLRTGGQT